jgi:L-lactate dehydrogenase complex protein LldF
VKGVASGDHSTRAAAFLEDRARARWHDASLWFVREKRDTAARALPEWEDLRDSARALKRHTLSRLDHYLETFEANAISAGARVHWASEAAELGTIVNRILDAHAAQKIVKSKSMLTEECGLNAALEAAGREVVDTDLGERIVQLRHEPPSHIVMPAIHLRKQEVGSLFERELGSPAGMSDPTRLTAVAREHLRTKFLGAEAGITGVNFAVAETGGFVVCTNEGNADLGTVLPPLHIACMGLEKLVPELRDLPVFLRLLARSATGQAITAYTSHFHGPAPGGELHIVIVDNGRSALLTEPELEPALACIRCGACLNTCPVYRRSGGHSYGSTIPGPIGSVLEPAKSLEAHRSLPFACTLCGSCAGVCPVKVPLPQQLLALRGRVTQQGHLRPLRRSALRFAAGVLQRPGWFRLLGALARRATRLPGVLALLRRTTWGRSREIPVLPKQSFRELWAERRHGR